MKELYKLKTGKGTYGKEQITISKDDLLLINKKSEGLVAVTESSNYTLEPVSGTNKVQLLKDGVEVSEIDLTRYVDDTNLARLVSGAVDANGIATFTRDDATTFTIDFRNLIGVQPTKTSELNNDGENGVNPFITTSDIPEIDLSDYSKVTEVEMLLEDYTLTSELPVSSINILNSDGVEQFSTNKLQFDAYHTFNAKENEIRLDGDAFVNVTARANTATFNMAGSKTSQGSQTFSMPNIFDNPILRNLYKSFSSRTGYEIDSGAFINTSRRFGTGSVLPESLIVTYRLLFSNDQVNSFTRDIASITIPGSELLSLKGYFKINTIISRNLLQRSNITRDILRIGKSNYNNNNGLISTELIRAEIIDKNGDPFDFRDLSAILSIDWDFKFADDENVEGLNESVSVNLEHLFTTVNLKSHGL